MSIKLGQLVEVIWIDACLEEGHLPVEVALNLKPLMRRNAGYCLADDEESIQLTFGYIENFYKGARACDMVLIIPKSMVKEINPK